MRQKKNLEDWQVKWFEEQHTTRIARDKKRPKRERKRRENYRKEIKKTRGRHEFPATNLTEFVFYPERTCDLNTDSKEEYWQIKAYNIEDSSKNYVLPMCFETQDDCLEQLAKLRRQEQRGYKRVIQRNSGWGHWHLETLACGHRVLFTNSRGYGYVKDADTRLCKECLTARAA